ncbi:MAG: hypothetical protein KKG25_10255 [Bacteroidetes bacterium]|nr:hypothetical protein [Bacteroidota bacterium]MBU1485223.1 hypothetical protein [Bacteroidota bacterium]MBU1761414.1 hypothetical protein [Bacteroidota bacterium]MBU2267856.1 hypothetical protein [Bacteroidota bacterium]MBU2375473.1 hypothetical protein [Bacteroidota bacterium]
MNTVEEGIWDYIDGLSSLEEQEAISQLIANDPVYQDKYQELLAIQKDIQLIELDEPSMSFTNKVMDKVAFQIKPLSAKAMVDKRIIYGISAVFGVLLLVCLTIVFKGIDWSLSTTLPVKLNLDQFTSQINLSSASKNFILYGFLMFDTIAALMLMDKYLRKRLA